MNPEHIQQQLNNITEGYDLQHSVQRLYLHLGAHAEGHLVPLGTGKRALGWIEGMLYTDAEVKAVVSAAHKALAAMTNQEIA